MDLIGKTLTLYKNVKRESKREPHWKGRIKEDDETVADVALWKGKTQDGTPSISIKFSPPYKAKPKRQVEDQGEDFDDDIPF